MGTVWLTCCSPCEYPELLDEVARRDPSAQLLRFGDVEALGSMVDAFPSARCNAAIHAGALERADVEEAVASLARSGRAGRIIVAVDRADPAVIARLFHAGAHEVIAAHDADYAYMPPSGACEVGGPSGHLVDRAWGGDDDEPPWAPPEPADSGQYRVAAGLAPSGGSDGADAPAPPSGSGAGTSEFPVPGSCDASGAGGDWRGSTGRIPCPAAAPARSDATGAGASAHAGEPSPAASDNGAPVVTVLSGRGGAGKTTLVAAMGCAAAHLGLRVALVDLDLMFGNLYELLGVDSPGDLGRLMGASASEEPDGSFEAAVEACAMRIGPGLTLWGPLDAAEHAELMAKPFDRLLALLRGVADVVFVDTSVFWGDAVAAAVSASERCLIVGGSGASSSSAKRAVRLAARLGVPQTRMTSVLMGLERRDDGEEPALRFEMACALRSRARVSDGGDEVRSARSFARYDSLVAEDVPFARDVRKLTGELLRELGCPVREADAAPTGSAAVGARQRIRLPWGKRGEPVP